MKAIRRGSTVVSRQDPSAHQGTPMAGMQFTCPHCSGVFQVDHALCGAQVACPHCQGVVVVPAAPLPASARPNTAPMPAAPQMPTVPRISPEEREKRRRTKNLILWAFGLIIIAVTLYILLAVGPL